ncbi:peptidoglycan recognition protein family protein [Actinomadura flavalba]|uniref:peptidoglycan recognition protein family protein n=1 Tax=Actinomadura flavalba TaxID=1120938 RepID=UPI0003784107
MPVSGDSGGYGGAPPTRRMMLGAAAALGLPLLASPAAAAEPEPEPEREVRRPRVYTRLDWEAVPPTAPVQVLDRAPDRVVVHHTATTNSKDLSLGHAFKLSRAIQRFHMQDRGWSDVGQQLTIGRGGQVMEGREGSLVAIATGRHVVGAQALGHNEHTIGIENEGTYMWADVPASLWTSLVDTCTWLCLTYDLDPVKAIVGHRDLGNTDCPGDVLYARLPELRAEVAMRLGLPAAPVRRPERPVRPRRDRSFRLD